MATINDLPLGDRQRFATAFIFCNDRQAIHWDGAAAQYDAKVMPQSFRTVTQRAMKKAVTNKADIPEGDVNRFALCYIFAVNRHDVDWTGAAAAYDPKVKPESFRTVTQRALKKVEFAPVSTPVAKSAKGKAGKKKPVEDNDDDQGDADEASAKPKKAKKTFETKRTKKATTGKGRKRTAAEISDNEDEDRAAEDSNWKPVRKADKTEDAGEDKKEDEVHAHDVVSNSTAEDAEVGSDQNNKSETEFTANLLARQDAEMLAAQLES